MLSSESFRFRLVLLGDGDAGKAVLLRRLRMDHCLGESTGDYEYLVLYLEIDEKLVRVAIRDTNSREIFQSISSRTYRDMHCIAVVYSVLYRNSFKSVGRFISAVRDRVSADAFIVLIGNHCNSPDRVVTRRS
jgi:GTPase SAR1 family protein